MGTRLLIKTTSEGILPRHEAQNYKEPRDEAYVLGLPSDFPLQLTDPVLTEMPGEEG